MVNRALYVRQVYRESERVIDFPQWSGAVPPSAAASLFSIAFRVGVHREYVNRGADNFEAVRGLVIIDSPAYALLGRSLNIH